jgi:hypothetical protein
LGRASASFQAIPWTSCAVDMMASKWRANPNFRQFLVEPNPEFRQRT